MPASVVLSDLSCCEPAAALSRDPAPDQWGVYDYETAAIAGCAVYCRPHFDPPPPCVCRCKLAAGTASSWASTTGTTATPPSSV